MDFNDSFTDSDYYSETEVDRLTFRNPEIYRVIQDLVRDEDQEDYLLPFSSLWYNNIYAINIPVLEGELNYVTSAVYYNYNNKRIMSTIGISTNGKRLVRSLRSFHRNLVQTCDERLIVQSEITVKGYQSIKLLISIDFKETKPIHMARLFHDCALISSENFSFKLITLKKDFQRELSNMLEHSYTVRYNYSHQHPFYGWSHM